MGFPGGEDNEEEKPVAEAETNDEDTDGDEEYRAESDRAVTTSQLL